MYSLIKRYSSPSRVLLDLYYRGITYPPVWGIYYPLHAYGVGRVCYDLQVCQDVLYLCSVVEPYPAHDRVWDPIPHQQVFHDPRLGVSAVEYSEIPEHEFDVLFF